MMKKLQSNPKKQTAEEHRGNIEKNKLNDAEISSDWTQIWLSPKQTQGDGPLEIHEVVRGPFICPKLLKTQPFLVKSSRRMQDKRQDIIRNDYRGIPDTWSEYLVFLGIKDTRILDQNLIPYYIRCHITDSLWNQLGLPFVQGIPDPFRDWSDFHNKSVKCLQGPCTREEGNPITKYRKCTTDCNYDKIQKPKAKKRFKKCNKRMDDKNNAVSEFFVPRQEGSDEKPTEDSKVESNEKQFGSTKPLSQRGKKKPDEKMLQKPEMSVDAKLNVKSIPQISPDDIASTSVVQRKETLKEKLPILKHKDKQKKYLNACKQSNTIGLQTDNHFNRSYVNVNHCDCMLHNTIHNRNVCIGPRTSGRVLCIRCENIYRASGTQRSNFASKSIDFQPRNTIEGNIRRTVANSIHEDRYKPAKRKMRFYFQKALQTFQSQNLLSRQAKRLDETNDTAEFKKDMRLICCKCNCPYMKIASKDHANVSQQCKHSQPKVKLDESNKVAVKDENEMANLKDRTIEKRSKQVVHDSKNYCRTRAGNKAHSAKQVPEHISHSKDIKSRSNLTHKKTWKDSTRNNNFNSKMVLGISQIHPKYNIIYENSRLIKEENERRRKNELVTDKNQHFIGAHNEGKKTIERNAEKNNCVGEILEETYQCNKICLNRMSRKKVESNDISDSAEDEKEVKYLQHSRSDECIVFVESDSGDHADTSDTSVDANINVPNPDRLSVTSISLMRRFDKGERSRIKHYQRRKPGKIHGNYSMQVKRPSEKQEKKGEHISNGECHGYWCSVFNVDKERHHSLKRVNSAGDNDHFCQRV